MRVRRRDREKGIERQGRRESWGGCKELYPTQESHISNMGRERQISISQLSRPSNNKIIGNGKTPLAP